MSDPGHLPAGTPIPRGDTHAILLSLSTWQDTLDWAGGDPSWAKDLVSGYPRYFRHALIRKLEADLLAKQGGKADEICMIFPTDPYADNCKAFILARTSQISPPSVRKIPFSIFPKGSTDGPSLKIHAVFFPKSLTQITDEFWTLTGFGISSRLAEQCLDLWAGKVTGEKLKEAAKLAATCKQTLRSRIASLLVSTQHVTEIGHHINGQVHEDDVFLYPTGMTAIWNAYQLVMKLRPGLKSVCFGFPYTDSLKVLQQWGPGYYFFGHDADGDGDSDMQALKKLLAKEQISALFCELPSNPVLRSPPLDQLRTLANQYGFLIVLDDTVGSFANIDALDYVDIVATSLTKWFCGYANVVAGSLAFNPRMKHYKELKATQLATYVDSCFDGDIIVTEYNSRDFLPRMKITNTNTEALCDFFRSRSLAAHPTDKNFVIKEVFYPKWDTRKSYDICRRKYYTDGQAAGDNFGGLFSLTFVSVVAAQTFYDDLRSAKGPSLGTVFTLACPYVILAHLHELEWAAKYGVEEASVRVSVGKEKIANLLHDFKAALKKAEDKVKSTS